MKEQVVSKMGENTRRSFNIAVRKGTCFKRKWGKSERRENSEHNDDH